MKEIIRNKGITLIALVITIILLLILAGITIATLKNSNLFENAKIAGEKYDVSKQNEENVLNDYINKIDLATTRDKNLNISVAAFNEWKGQSSLENTITLTVNVPKVIEKAILIYSVGTRR